MKDWTKRVLFATPFLLLWLALFIAPVLWVFHINVSEGTVISRFGLGNDTGLSRVGSWTFAAIRYVVTDETTLGTALIHLAYGVLMALLCLFLGIVLSVGLCELIGHSKGRAQIFAFFSSVINIFVLFAGLKWVLFNAGPIQTIVHGLHAEPFDMLDDLFSSLVRRTYLIVPYVALIMTAQMMRVDRSQIMTTAGQSSWKIYHQSIIPSCRGAFRTCVLISLVWGVGAYLLPLVFTQPEQLTLSIEMQRQILEGIDWPYGRTILLILMSIFAGSGLITLLLAKAMKGR